jgi:RimJ/RimL family protein N-acetyltransferase
MNTEELPLGPQVLPVSLPLPQLEARLGFAVSLVPLSPSHLNDLWVAAQSAEASWAYLRYGPFNSIESLHDHLQQISGRHEQPFFAIVPTASGRAEGWASFCDITPANASIEIGSIWFSPCLQRTRAASEAIFLMMDHAFALGYHRIVWRCNALNAASMHAAQRYGFTPEGIWREAEIVKGRRRDNAWFSILENEWPEQKRRFEAWLANDNFDASGAARRSMERGADLYAKTEKGS